MGGPLSCHRSPEELRGGRRKFSAACTFSSVLVVHERLDINTSTEEELMTLPGVSRAVAHNIVEHRERVGGFRKVEDLVVVSGVGASRLESIRMEVCVSSSRTSDQTGININTATPAQLLSIRPLTEELVHNIVSYRSEHGPFRSIEDLVKVSHINSSLLDRIRLQVHVQRTPSTTTRSTHHPSPTSFSPSSEDLELPAGGPAHLVSVRPDVEPPRHGACVVRVGSWSLQDFSCGKANNPGVREVVSMTLLENQ